MICDIIGVLTTSVDPVFTGKSFDIRCSVLGRCNPDDDPTSLLGSDVLVAGGTFQNSAADRRK